MKPRLVVPGVYELPLGQVNAHLIESRDGLILIDTGYPKCAAAIVQAIESLGRTPRDLQQIVVTHCHPDHAGSLAEIKRLTGAPAAMHPLDAEMTRAGRTLRPLVAGPGLFNRLVYSLLIRRALASVEPAKIEHEVADGQVLAGGLRAIHAPGHCAGQISLLWPEQGGVLFAADTCAHVFGLAMSPAYENLDEGRRTLARLARETFEVAVFGHGRPMAGASDRFRRKWPVA